MGIKSIFKATMFWRAGKGLFKTGSKATSATGSLAKGALLTYGGFKFATTDKGLLRVGTDMLMGEKNVDQAVDKVKGTVDAVTGMSNATVDAVNGLSGTVNNTTNGISSFLQSMSSGNGGNMLSGFFSNLIGGRVSGMGMAGLIGAAILAFGNFGWFGKIAAALLSMFIIGGNKQVGQSMQHVSTAPDQQETADGKYSRASVYTAQNDGTKVFVKAWDLNDKALPSLSLVRTDYDRLVSQGFTPAQIYAGLEQKALQTNQQVSQDNNVKYSRNNG